MARGNAQERQSAHMGSLEIDASYNKRNERSNSSYHNQWFCVLNEDRKLELIHNKEGGQENQSASVGF